MPAYLPDLTTLDAVKENNGIPAVTTSDDAMLTRFIHQASAWFQRRSDRVFVPYYDEWTQDYAGASMMDFEDEVLELAGVTNGDATAIASSAYRLIPSNHYPKYRIQLLPSQGVVFTFDTDRMDAITFRGTLGVHDDYDHAYATMATATGALNTTDDALAVSDSSPFEVLQYIRHAAGGELSQVTAVTTGTLTLDRGVQGTTPTAQTAGTAVQVYQENPDVQSAVDHIVSWMYDNRDTSGRTIQFGEGGSKLMEGALPKYAVDVLNDRMRRVIEA